MRKGEPVFNIKEEPKIPVESPADQETNSSLPFYGTIVNSPFVSIHEYAADTAPVKDYVTSGETVEIEGETSGFYIVRFGRGRRLGFINHNFIRRC